MEIGDHICSYFLDDRADLVAWLLALETIKSEPLETEVIFAATTSEEVGGEGAQYLLHKLQPDICVALEIGPSVPESPFEIDENPTVWVTDTFASMSAIDLDILAEIGETLGQRLHWQPISRGGSDASCSASKGLTARPVTLGFPVENSHGLEIMHRDAPGELARLTVAYLRRVAAQDS
jgi:putative aminopeptidase FrvX